jgi:meso-butanediol dehydrogenase/(S,S)-butanediol dehydrogenase/diacetyl reductase
MGVLEGKTAVVTGGGTGIGRAIAKRFRDEGATVVICGRREQVLQEALSSISPDGSGVSYAVADVTKDEDINKLVDTAKAAGGIDILVNNAAFMRFAPLADTDEKTFEELFRVNVLGVWKVMNHVYPVMEKAGGGSIINISSIAGHKAFPGTGAYCTSKAAVIMLSQVAAMEYAGAKVRVNIIAPGLIEDTELALPIFGEEKVEDFYAKLRPLHPLGRSGRSADIAEAALFFARDGSEWVSGVMMPVDGARHLATNRPPT